MAGATSSWLMQAFPSLAKISFQLVKDEEVFRSDQQWLTFASQELDSSRKRKPPKREIFIAVKSLQKPFSGVKTEEGLSWLGVTCAKEVKETWNAPELDLETSLPEKVMNVTGWQTVKDVLEHLGKDLAAWAYTSSPENMSKEVGCRELISCVLLAAAIIDGEIDVHAKFQVDGLRGAGRVDWVMRYRKLCIVIVEAKLWPEWENYQGQLTAAMISSREDFSLSVLGSKRKWIEKVPIPEMPSYGVLTNGRLYKFYEYHVKEGVKELVESKTMMLELTHGMSFQDCMSAATPVVALLVHILKMQKRSFGSAQAPKRPCT